MLKEIFSQNLNTQSQTVCNSLITFGNTDYLTAKGRKFISRFIQPGIAGYPGQLGNALITKESFDKFIHTLNGKPVIINHQIVTTENREDIEVGTVENVWFNPQDGWYWCDGYIKDETAQGLINDKKWSVSCSYNILLADDEGGTENNVNYDIEILNGEFTHLALVNNPRYERANIVLNSKTQIFNGGVGSGDFNHAGRPGKVGGSEKAGTGREGKYDEGYQSAKKDGFEGSWKEYLEEQNVKLKKVETEKPQEINKKEENGIEIKKETKKAYLLNKDGVNFWVQKRWYKDGNLTPAGEKSFEEAKEVIKTNEENKNKNVKFNASWESEKAYGVDIPFDMYDLEKTVSMRVFIPKSMVSDGAIPYWLYEKKIKEAYEKMTEKYAGNYGGYMHMSGGFNIENAKTEIFTVIDGELYEIISNTAIQNFNPNHNEKGQFCAADDAVTPFNKIKETDLYNNLPSELKEAIAYIYTGKPVYNVTGEEFPDNGEDFKSLLNRIADFYKDNFSSKINIENFGEVLLDKKSVKNSSYHNFNKNKINAFAAVPYVLLNGKRANYDENYKGKNEDRYLFVAPITIKGENYFCEVIVKATDRLSQSGVKRFYLHEIELTKELDDVFLTPYGRTSSSSKSIIADKINKFKGDDMEVNNNKWITIHPNGEDSSKEKQENETDKKVENQLSEIIENAKDTITKSDLTLLKGLEKILGE